MSKLIRRLMIGLVAIFSVLVTAAVPDTAEAAGFSWHIRNSPASNLYVTISNEGGCTGSREESLFPGQNADSLGWDSFEVPGVEPFRVVVYNGSTGAWIVTRDYPAGTNWCVTAYNANDYLVYVY